MKETRGESYSQMLIGSAAPHSDLACFCGVALNPYICMNCDIMCLKRDEKPSVFSFASK